MAQLIGHEVHGGSYMCEECAVGRTEVVERTLSFSGRWRGVSDDEAVFGTATVAGKEPFTSETLRWQAVALGAPEGHLFGTEGERG